MSTATYSLTGVYQVATVVKYGWRCEVCGDHSDFFSPIFSKERMEAEYQAHKDEWHK